MLKHLILLFSILFIVNCSDIDSVDYSATGEDVTLDDTAKDDEDVSLVEKDDDENTVTVDEDKFDKDDYEEDEDELRIRFTTRTGDTEFNTNEAVLFRIEYPVVENDLEAVYLDFDTDGDIDFIYNNEADLENFKNGDEITKNYTFTKTGDYEATAYAVDTEGYIFESSYEITIK